MEERKIESKSERKFKVLLVEDEQETQKLIKSLIGRHYCPKKIKNSTQNCL